LGHNVRLVHKGPLPFQVSRPHHHHLHLFVANAKLNLAPSRVLAFIMVTVPSIVLLKIRQRALNLYVELVEQLLLLLLRVDIIVNAPHAALVTPLSAVNVLKSLAKRLKVLVVSLFIMLIVQSIVLAKTLERLLNLCAERAKKVLPLLRVLDINPNVLLARLNKMLQIKEQ